MARISLLSTSAAAGTYVSNASFLRQKSGLFASVPFTARKTMTTPPTVATDAGQAQGNAGTTGSTLTGTLVNLPYNTTGKWRFLGGVGYTSGSAYFTNGLFPVAAGTSPTARIDFMFEGSELEIIWRATAGAPAGWRLMVDGEWATPTTLSPGATGLRYFTKVTFATRAVRRITWEFDSIAFGGLNVRNSDTVWQPPAERFRAMFLGDSYSIGTGATRPGDGWAMQCANYLGWTDVVCNGQSGTGYMNAGSTGRQKFLDRLAVSVTPYAPNIIVIMGGFNDSVGGDATRTPANVGAAAGELFAVLATALPNTPLVVTGSQASAAINGSGETFDRTAAILAAASAAPNVVKAIDMTNASPWITGNGRVGTPGSTAGNADVLISTDGAHPSQDGHNYYAGRIAREIRDYIVSA